MWRDCVFADELDETNGRTDGRTNERLVTCGCQVAVWPVRVRLSERWSSILIYLFRTQRTTASDRRRRPPDSQQSSRQANSQSTKSANNTQKKKPAATSTPQRQRSRPGEAPFPPFSYLRATLPPATMPACLPDRQTRHGGKLIFELELLFRAASCHLCVLRSRAQAMPTFSICRPTDFALSLFTFIDFRPTSTTRRRGVVGYTTKRFDSFRTVQKSLSLISIFVYILFVLIFERFR